MTNEHPAFWPFCNRLGETFRHCDHSLDASIEILNTIPGIDIPASLDWLRSQGGHCDCEVMFNVACRYEDEARRGQ